MEHEEAATAMVLDAAVIRRAAQDDGEVIGIYKQREACSVWKGGCLVVWVCGPFKPQTMTSRVMGLGSPCVEMQGLVPIRKADLMLKVWRTTIRPNRWRAKGQHLWEEDRGWGEGRLGSLPLSTSLHLPKASCCTKVASLPAHGARPNSRRRPKGPVTSTATGGNPVR